MKIRPFLMLTAAALIMPGVAVADFGKPHGDRSGGFHEMRAERFAAYDRDGDGKITAEEVKSVEAERFDAVDANHDGALTVDELAAMIEKRRRERLEARLARLDRDDDGTVTADELAAVHTGWFARLDHDGDGVVTKEEFAAPRRYSQRGHGDGHGRHGGYDRHQGDDRHGGWGHRRDQWRH